MEIGNIVKYERDSSRSYIILASKSQRLSKEFLKSLTGQLRIQNISELANTGITTIAGFDFTISPIKHFNEGIVVLTDELINVFSSQLKI